jgi:hypothetical protein
MAEPARDVRYTAFLSYSHKDAAAAGKLHRRLEAYRMPKRLVGTQGARGPVPARLSPIFRDREELPAATDLSETVREALDQSGALIILCSPAAAESLWVAEEIATFRRLHPDRPILAAILDGDPPECFPKPLRAFGRDGTWHEPLATDLRPGKDGKQLGLLKLVAGITGVGLDALVQRDAARRVRRITTLSMLTLIAMLIMTALAAVALDARREAERQRAEAEGLVEFMLTDLRTKLRGVGRVEIMSTVNRRALAYYDRQQRLNGGTADSAMRARVKHSIGEDELDNGHSEAAAAAWEEAYRSTSSLIARFPNDASVIFAHAQSEFWLGYLNYVRGNTTATRQAWLRYKALTDRLLAIEARNPHWIREAGYSEGSLCTLAMRPRIIVAEAMPLCTSSLRRMEEVRRLQGLDPELSKDLANRHGYMVDLWVAQGQWDRAMAHRRTHEAFVQSLIESDPQNLDYRDIWMRSQDGFGRILARRGDHTGARRRFEDAARVAAMLTAADPENADWRDWQTQIARRLQQERRHGPR